ncbi:hypothetical protein ABIA32_003065 [Streptacidiphilus sp. MAP12-20]|uniref:hypothetical protein n=1 Tax=Streptacidiphilus sp. MAP12-20 TaxID=3156299 RepID=UPI003513841D
MTLSRLVRRLLTATVLTAALLPPAAHADASTRSPDPYHCTAPAHVGIGIGSGIGIALDWPHGPVPPGTPQALGIHITNFTGVPTPDPTLVVVHNFVPNTFTAPPGITLTDFSTGVSFTIPAGISAGATFSTSVTVKLGASIPPNTTEHCDVTAFSGADQAAAAAAYDVVTGDPVVHVEAAVLPATGKPGQTIPLQVVFGNAGPSNEYAGPAVFTFKAPAHTTWATPSGYRCTPDAAATTLTCTYPGAPLTWRNELEQLPLSISPGVHPGDTLTGGCITGTDPFDPETFHGADFDVKVTA